MLRRQSCASGVAAAASAAAAAAAGAHVAAMRGVAGSPTVPVWTGPLRDGTPRDPKKMKGGEAAHREDMTKEYNLNPFADHYIRYNTPMKLEPTLKSEKDKLEVQRLRDAVEVPEYAVSQERAYFEKGVFAPNPNDRDRRVDPATPKGTADLVKTYEFETIFGKFEIRPTGTGHVGTLRYNNYKRIPPKETIPSRTVWGMGPQHEGHHPYYDYSANSGLRQGYTLGTGQSYLHWDLKVASHSLYRAAVRSLPLMKHYYYLHMSLEKMQQRVRKRFEMNRHVKDPDAVRHLIALGWVDFTECIMFRKTKMGMFKYFYDDENMEDMMAAYAVQEGRATDEKAFWNGEEQRKNGPYDGHWSWIGKKNQEEFERLAGRVPVSWSAGKGYFEVFEADGTNYWEKNLDYEGWFIKNVDPDRRAARLEMQSWVDAGYTAPKHYSSKNRRGYRRLVKDIENVMRSTPHEMYAESREMLFQFWVREWSPESNRVHAEKRLARHDDDVFTTKFDELEKPIKQAMREMPNPRLWRTDAFYLRVRYLQAFYEYNWAKVPIGAAFDKLYNEWVSNDVNYAILSSPQFEAVKKDKARNPMARTWADFYRDYDPDVEATRRLPWYHAAFDYDRRHHWDERCMRMKKWVESGDVDGTLPFFESEVAKYEQHINRFEATKYPGALEYKYSAPRYVQLYRGLAKRMDVALVNQLREFLMASGALTLTAATTGKDVAAALDKAKLADFRFVVPTVVFPDNVEQPRLDLDGRPVKEQVTA
jgi:hypothetical protein